MAIYNVKFIKGYSKWFKLPVENLVNIVIDTKISGATRKFICETRLKGILTYEEINTSRRRKIWVKNNPKWVNLEYYRRSRMMELEAQELELDNKFEPEVDHYEIECC